MHGVARICYGSTIAEEILSVLCELIGLLGRVADLRNFLCNEALKNCALAILYLFCNRGGLGLDLGSLALNAGQLGGIAALGRFQGSNVVIRKLGVFVCEGVNTLVDEFVR